jgi:hypothetical protein
MGVNSRGAAIALHYEDVWGSPPVYCEWSDLALRVRELPAGFAVLRFEPANRDRPWKYATVGMSAPADEHAIELHMICDKPEDDCAAILTLAAYFHRTSARLGVGHSVEFGRPWVANSQCSFGLISLPYLDGPKLEWCCLDGREHVRCLWLLPMTPEEARFKRDNGPNALEERFEASGFNYADPWRPCVL